MTSLRVLLLLLLATLIGCTERTIDVYLYGANNSCFPAKNNLTCDRLKIYDTVDLKILLERQEVTYVQKGLWLDDSNAVFRKLNDCKVIDRGNFSCDGLVRIDGQFTNTSVFKTLFVSTTYLPSAWSRYLHTPISRRTLEFWERNSGWLTALIIVFALFALLGITSRT